MVFGFRATSLTEAMIKGAQAGIIGAFLGFLVAKVILAFLKQTPEDETRLRD
jgi:predicted PurR-regulated permease PerM